MLDRARATINRLIGNIPAARKVLQEAGRVNLAGQLERDRRNLVYWRGGGGQTMPQTLEALEQLRDELDTLINAIRENIAPLPNTTTPDIIAMFDESLKEIWKEPEPITQPIYICPYCAEQCYPTKDGEALRCPDCEAIVEFADAKELVEP